MDHGTFGDSLGIAGHAEIGQVDIRRGTLPDEVLFIGQASGVALENHLALPRSRGHQGIQGFVGMNRHVLNTLAHGAGNGGIALTADLKGEFNLPGIARARHVDHDILRR